MNEIETLLEEFNRVTGEYGKFHYMSRGKEFQQEAVGKYTTLKQKVASLKERRIKLENLIDAMINELKMWIALKEDKPNEDWDFLINAQSSVRTAAQVHEIAINLNAEEYANRLHLIEKLLFSPQIFFSPSFVIKKAECSICGKEYGECEHVVGKAYMEKMCYKIIKEFEIREISIVEDPADKHTTALQFTDDKGITRDFMTWRKIEKDE